MYTVRWMTRVENLLARIIHIPIPLWYGNKIAVISPPSVQPLLLAYFYAEYSYFTVFFTDSVRNRFSFETVNKRVYFTPYTRILLCQTVHVVSRALNYIRINVNSLILEHPRKNHIYTFFQYNRYG